MNYKFRELLELRISIKIRTK